MGIHDLPINDQAMIWLVGFTVVSGLLGVIALAIGFYQERKRTRENIARLAEKHRALGSRSPY